MQQIIPPIGRDQLISELTRDKLLRKTNYGKNEIYVFTYHDSPALMKEVGRLRELTFRAAGGGTGEETDIDRNDKSDNPYLQLIVWNPKEKEILGGYRYFLCHKAKNLTNKEDSDLSTTRLFNLSQEFITDYLPYTIELGRSFIQPRYQFKSAGRKGLFTLDNLWDGLGGLWVENPNMKYFFGKVTMYSHYNAEAKNLLLYFMNKHFEDKKNLVVPIQPVKIDFENEKYKKLFSKNTYKEDYVILSKRIRALDENIPPLINAYMNLSPTMKTFGTAINPHFGGVEETGIMVTVKDIYPKKASRHVLTHKQ
ncbi:GNAT family N-acetyltransferase [Bacteroidota bacterium]